MMENPSYREMKKYVTQIFLKFLPVTTGDIAITDNAFGPNIPSLQGKTKESKDDDDYDKDGDRNPTNDASQNTSTE